MIFPCQCTSRSTTFLYADICLQVTLVNSHVRCPKALKLISAYEMSNTFQLNLDWGFIKYCWLMALSFWTFTEGKKSPPTPSLSFRWIFMSYFLILLDLSVTNKGASLVAQLVKNLPAMWETRVWFLGWEDPWGRKWQPTPVFLPGESHGQRSLAGYSSWGCKSCTRLSDYITKPAPNVINAAWLSKTTPCCFFFCISSLKKKKAFGKTDEKIVVLIIFHPLAP